MHFIHKMLVLDMWRQVKILLFDTRHRPRPQQKKTAHKIQIFCGRCTKKIQLLGHFSRLALGKKITILHGSVEKSK